MIARSQADSSRIVSLDQFRGYTVAGMLLVNFVGGFREVGALWKHHNTYCSYADTIMPQFFFAVGFAYRLTYLRRLRTQGFWPATSAVVRRTLGLCLLGFVLYHLDGKVKAWDELCKLGPGGVLARGFRREPFQTLVHIALASLWALPVIAAGTMTRVAFLVASTALHLVLSHWFYFQHAWSVPVIDGGPLGFLTWCVPLLVGSLAYDVIAAGENLSRSPMKLLAWSAILTVLGYALSCLGGSLPPPPFVPPSESAVPNLCTMSQRTGSSSYQTFGAGFSLAVYALFVFFCDRCGVAIGLFRTFGLNPLAAYILHSLVASAVKPYVPSDAPLWYVASGFLLYFGICYLMVRYLEKNHLFLRL